MRNKLLWTLLLIIVISVILWIYKSISTSNYEKTELSVGIQMVDQDNKPILRAIKIRDNKFKETFLVNASSNKDTYFDVMLINNFKQMNFSINGGKEARIQQLFIPKTSKGNYFNTGLEISIDNIDNGLNDSELIFLKKIPDPSILKMFPSRNTYTTRFAFYNDDSNKDIKHLYLSDYQKIEGDLPHDILLFNRSINKISENQSEYNNVISSIEDIKVNKNTKLNIYINLKESISGSPFFDDYLKDEKFNIKQPFAIIALLDGELYPLHYSGLNEENFKLYEVELGKSIMVSPEIKIYKKGIHCLNLLVIPYPYSDPERFFGSYKMSSWSNIISSYVIPITVSE